MRPLFQADADLNQEVVPGPRRREPAVDFQHALAGGVIGIPDKPVPAGLAADPQPRPGNFVAARDEFD